MAFSRANNDSGSPNGEWSMKVSTENYETSNLSLSKLSLTNTVIHLGLATFGGRRHLWRRSLVELAQVPRIQIPPRALQLHVFRRFMEAVGVKIAAR